MTPSLTQLHATASRAAMTLSGYLVSLAREDAPSALRLRNDAVSALARLTLALHAVDGLSGEAIELARKIIEDIDRYGTSFALGLCPADRVERWSQVVRLLVLTIDQQGAEAKEGRAAE